jgi:ornithine cyclodeaminase/alanine dehydrogenase-like protein (mu-crystallin family)
MLVLSHRQVEELLDLDALIEALAIAMADLSAGRASVPRRNFAMAGASGILAAMPAYLPTQNVLAAKLVLVFPGNATQGLETHQAVVAVFDPATGVPMALMDGASITAIRTAAGSALATRLCAREGAKVLAILGTGVQARSHARAVPRVRNISEIVVAGRTPAKVAAFAAEIGASVASTYAEAVAAADIVCCCTNATEPVVRREWLRPGTHVNSVGFTKGPELDPRVFADALVVVESRATAIGEFPNGAVDITAAVNQHILQLADIREVGELVQGMGVGRTGEDQVTVYRSVGVAAQDAAAAGLALEAARGRGMGAEVRL